MIPLPIIRKKLLFILLLIPLLLISPPPTSAQDGDTNTAGIRFNVQVGFDGFYKAEFWLPIRITVANDGPAIEGEIRITTGSVAAGDTLIYNSPISLPTQSNKQVTLFIAPIRISSLPTIQLLNEQGQVMAQTPNNTLNLVGLDHLLYGVVSPDPGELDFLENVTGGRSRAAVAFLAIEDLPAVAVAWNALDILILNDIDTAQLSPAQLEALQEWVSTGGQLVVTGGPGWQKTTAALADMLPVTLTGSESVDDLPALHTEIGLPFRDPGPYLIATSSLRNGELLYHQDGLPILAQQPWGRGSVYFLALDPKLAPLLDWDGSEVVFDAIARTTPHQPPWAAGFQNGYSAGSAVSSLPSLTLPSTFQLIIFLLIYVLSIGPINYLVLKRINRRELAWTTIPVLVLLFTVTAYITGFQLKGNSTILNQLSVAYGQTDSPYMQVHSLLGLYSPRRSTYDLTLPGSTVARPFDRTYGDISGNGNLDTVTRSTDLVMNNVLVDVSDVATFLAASYQETPAITGQATFRVNGSQVELDITLHNDSDTTLQTASVLAGTQVFPLGDIPAGQSITEHITMNRSAISGSSGSFIGPGSGSGSVLLTHTEIILGTTNYYSDAEAYPRWRLLEALNDSSGGMTVGTLPEDKVTLIAWTDELQVDATLDKSNYNTSGTTLYFLEVPLDRQFVSGDTISVPLSLLNWEVHNQENVYNPTVEDLYLNGGSVTFDYTPWQEFQTMSITALSIRLTTTSNSQTPPEIRLWDWQKEIWVTLENVAWGELTLADFATYLGPNNTVRLYIKDNQSGTSIHQVYPILTGTIE